MTAAALAVLLVSLVCAQGTGGLIDPDHSFVGSGEVRANSNKSFYVDGALGVGAAPYRENRHTVTFNVKTGAAPTKAGWSLDTYTYTVSVIGAGELGDAAITDQPTQSMVQTSATTQAWGISYGIPFNHDDEYPIRISADGPLVGRTVTVIVELESQWTQGSNHETDRSYVKVDYDVGKMLCTDASIDTRRMFGQPNADGSPGTDPNAPYQPVNFGLWDYRGGLFVGSMQATYSRDHSGTARIQLWPIQAFFPSTVHDAFLALLYKGTPPNVNPPGFAIYLPNPAPNAEHHLDTTETTVTWDTRWDSIVPIAGGGATNYWETPLATASAPASANEYVNFDLIPPQASLPAMALSDICVAMQNEYGVPFTFPSWAYFGAKDYLDVPGIVFPDTDCRPRVWRIGWTLGEEWTQ